MFNTTDLNFYFQRISVNKHASHLIFRAEWVTSLKKGTTNTVQQYGSQRYFATVNNELPIPLVNGWHVDFEVDLGD